MKRYTYAMLISLFSLVCCERQIDARKKLVNVFFSASINGVPHISGEKVELGAIVKTDKCDFDIALVGLFRYEPGNDDWQVLYFDRLPSKTGKYHLASNPQFIGNVYNCATDSVVTSMDFRSGPRDGSTYDIYVLVPDSDNYVKVLFYDKRLHSIQGEFQATFVRQNRVPRSPNAADTVRYTNGKFLLTNMHVQEVITEPR